MAVVMMFLPLVAPAVNTIIHTAYYNSATIGTDTLGGVTYATVHYEGLYNGGAPGTPSLPVDYIRFSVPYNATNFTVTAQPKNTYSLGLNYPVYPCQEPRMMSDTTPVVITLPDSAAYYSGSDYPTQRAWVVDEGFLAGENHIVTVAVMPFAYRYSASGFYRHTFKESRSVRLTLSYELSDSLAMYPIVRNDSILRQEGYVLTQSMVANPSSVIANAPVEMTMDSLIFINPNQGDGLNGGDKPTFPSDSLPTVDPSIVNGGSLWMMEDYYPFMIITTSELEHSVRRIAALKRQKGYNVKVVTMDAVLNSPFSLDGDRIKQEDGTYLTTFTDNAGKLRQYLKHYFIEHGTKFVLLAGNDIPYRVYQGIPTDWYYSDLNCDFSKDFYNSYKDSLDFYAELNVGRLLAKTPEQIDNYADKMLKYELNPGNGDFTYLKSAVATQGRELEVFNQYKSIVTYFLPQLFDEVDYIKEQDGEDFPTGKAIIDSINYNKYGFICSLNHGSPYGMNVYGHNCDNSVTRHYVWAIDSIKDRTDAETGNGINNLQNKNYPMVYYSISCETMPFGYNTGTSFGESFTLGKDYGGPVYVGHTTDIPNAGGIESFRNFMKYLLLNKYSLGEVYSLSKKGHDGKFINRLPVNAVALNYLGDPSIELWSDIPQTYSNVTVTRGDSTIRISGIEADSTIMVVRGISSELLFKRIVSTSTVRFSHISPNINITLYKHNFIPYILPLTLQNIAINKPQYIFASDIVAGKIVDTGRASGDVIVNSGIEFEIEAKGTVILQDGFKVEKGAKFAVYPSSF